MYIYIYIYIFIYIYRNQIECKYSGKIIVKLDNVFPTQLDITRIKNKHCKKIIIYIFKNYNYVYHYNYTYIDNCVGGSVG